MIRIIRSGAAAERLAAARAFIGRFPPATERLLIGASRDSVDALAGTLLDTTGAVFGLRRTTPSQLAHQLAAPALAARGWAPATALTLHAIAARAVLEARRRNVLTYLAPAASAPGFSAALAATLDELRHHDVAPDRLRDLPAPGPDLAALTEEFAAQLAAAGVADRPTILSLAVAALSRPDGAWVRGRPLLWLDAAVRSTAERRFAAALFAAAPDVLATVPRGDEETIAAFRAIAATDVEDSEPDENGGRTTPNDAVSLRRLQGHLFASEPPPAAAEDGTVRLLSAPGEGRECVEIARRILEEAGRGVPFDDMAVLLRAPDAYTDRLESALRRAGVPAYFAAGAARPDPAGRALVALLTCRARDLSARHVAEYLSFGTVPDDGEVAANAERWVAPNRPDARETMPMGTRADESDASTSYWDPDAPVAAGQVRAPWRWEALLGDHPTGGGRERWHRRLDGIESELQLKLAEASRAGADSPGAVAARRDLVELGHLRRFALPIIDVLDAWPETATWGEWLAVIVRLVPMVVRRPDRLLAVLGELQPMAPLGPVSLDEVREVLAERLSTLDPAPPPSRYGRLFVSTPEQARGRSFAVVFVPGLAERTFPRPPREDPLLLDALRQRLDAGLPTRAERGGHERLLLRLAVGAARERLYLSYPRIDVGQARPRVPSFYALDVVRAVRGHVPDFEALEREAAAAAQSRLAWPAPPDPRHAIDAVEHDLAVLGPMIRHPDPAAVAGRARYLLELNPHLARSLRSRWYRWQAHAWGTADGLVTADGPAAALLASHRLEARAYSPSALERFAACPYQFLLAAIHGFAPRRSAATSIRLDPLTRGGLFHSLQAKTLRALRDEGRLPLRPTDLPAALDALDAAVERVAADARERLAPPIPRVWDDGIDALRADLHLWLRHVAAADDDWEPIEFEWRFGATTAEDEAPTGGGVRMTDGSRLCGAVDLIERRSNGGTLRVTDHKTGADQTRRGLVVGGGETLQPVLYSLAVETATGAPVAEARLFFCTAAGGFAERVVPIDDPTRRLGLQALRLIDGAIARAFLPPAPRPDACETCEFGDVCGPYEEIRSAKKDGRALADLARLRGLP